MKQGNKIEKKQAETLIEKYSTAMLRNDSSCKTTLCNIKGILVRISIVYTQKAVVFTNVRTDEQIVKFYE